MHLSPCHAPPGQLEPAPSTSLREAAAGEQWDGFWCVADERYYTRCTGPSGRVQWYRIDERAVSARLGARAKSAAIIRFPARHVATPRMIVGRYQGRAMIVGTRRRRAPAGERR